MNQPQITVVLVTYQSREIVDAPLRVLRQGHKRGLLDCVVVDNASADGTVDFLREHHRWARIIPNTENVGYGRGCNLGLAFATAPYVLFMNPDVVIGIESLMVLARFLDSHPKAGIAAPATMTQRGPQKAGKPPTPLSTLMSAIDRKLVAHRHVEVMPGAAPFQVEWVCGAVMLARRDLVQRLGGFDPRFFLYFEETDLCRRIRKAGAELWMVGEAEAHHEANSSARAVRPELHDGGCLPEHFFSSRFYYFAKHHGWVAAVTAEAGEVAILAGKDMVRTVLRKPMRELSDRLRGPVFRLPAREV